MNAGRILIAPLLHLSCLCVAPGRVAITGRRYVFVIPHSLFIVAPQPWAASTSPAGPQAAMLAIL